MAAESVEMTRVLAWALFDLANTFFAVAMLSFYFPLWVVEDRGGGELSLSIALSVSMAVAALLMPLCGALSDATAERVRFLRWTTYGCIAATVLVATTNHLVIALVLFGVANVFYQLGTVLYDALLWQLAPHDRLGYVSGIGAAFGYIGSMTGLLFLWPFVRIGGHGAAFVPAGVFFLLFAVPSFLAIRETGPRRQISWPVVVRSAVNRLSATVRSARQLAGLWRYLWASFFSSNAISTILVFMAVYTKQVAGFSEAQVVRFFLFNQLFCVAGAIILSRLIPRLGAKATLRLIWIGWMSALGLAALNPSPQWLWGVGPVIGFFLGPTWATSRVLVIELAPRQQLAEIFGLVGLFARASSILGPLLWGLLAASPLGHRAALLALSVLLGIGIWLLQGVPQQRLAQGAPT